MDSVKQPLKKGVFLQTLWEPLENVYDKIWLVREVEQIPLLEKKQVSSFDDTVILRINSDHLGIFCVKVHLGDEFPYSGPTITILEDMCVCNKGTTIIWNDWSAMENRMHQIAIQ